MSRFTSKPTRGITAADLNNKAICKVIEEVVNEQVKIIDAKIQSANIAGFNVIEIDLPDTFGFNGLDKNEAQIMVYSDLIDLYSKPPPAGKGFIVSINIGPKSTLRVEWKNQINNAELARRKRIIQDHAVRKR